MGKLSGKVAVITGGNSGIGFATAKRFAEEGADVVITGRRKKELDEAASAIGKNVLAVQGDVSVLADLDRLYATVKQTRGHIDILFANAGIGSFAPLGAISEEHFDQLVGINVKGLLFTVQKALPLFRDGGSIILNSSVAGRKGIAGFSVYNATKAAVRSFARTWTSDLKERKIRVNSISPGPIETPIFGKMGLSQDQLQEFSNFLSVLPLGRTGQPEEIASVALFLASDESSYITGVDLCVDGGLAQV
jgi:NAD(P)-dependent dehydrogenase (short-subunit alcohol dehydrogenase family)